MDTGSSSKCLHDSEDYELYSIDEFVLKILMVAQTCHKLLKEPIFEDQEKGAVETAADSLKFYRQNANFAKFGGAAAGIAGNAMVISWKFSSSSASSALVSFGIALIVFGVAVTIVSDFAFRYYKWKVVENVKEVVENFIEVCLFVEAEGSFYTTLFQEEEGKDNGNQHFENLERSDTVELRKNLKDIQKRADDIKLNHREYHVLVQFFFTLRDFVSQTFCAFGEVWYNRKRFEDVSESAATLINELTKERNIILNIFVVLNEMGLAVSLTALSSTSHIKGDQGENQFISSLEKRYIKAALRKKAWDLFWGFLNIFNLLVNVATLLAVTCDLARNSPEEVADLFFKISFGMAELIETDMEKRKAVNSLLLTLGHSKVSINRVK